LTLQEMTLAHLRNAHSLVARNPPERVSYYAKEDCDLEGLAFDQWRELLASLSAEIAVREDGAVD